MAKLWDDRLPKCIHEFRAAPDTFLRQPTIVQTLHSSQQRLATDYYNELMNSTLFHTMLPKIGDGVVGNPHRFSLYPQCSPQTIQHAYYLNMINDRFGVVAPEHFCHVVEIGGGYGNLCRVFNNLGYAGKYTIIDLPEMFEIQQHYLNKHSMSAEFSSTPVSLVTHPSILFATFSVNEMSIAERITYESIYQYYNYLFFAYNTKIDENDNVEYFNKLGTRLSEAFLVEQFKDRHRNTFFMLCRKRVP